MQHSESLLLSQSYKESWADYQRSLTNPGFACWDYIILTASDERQSEGYRTQLNRRKEEDLLPSHTHFAVVADPDGKRVGSGGATLNVLRYIAEHRNSCNFSNLRILVIHSGGDSKRVPQYSALGKLFSPVPRELPSGKPSTLFDEFIISMSSVPSRLQEGMLLLSGDVLLLFNPLQLDFTGTGAVAISFKERVETGKNHGVFLCDGNNHVSRFLHKQTVETLKSYNAVNEQGCVDIDTGAVMFSKELITALFGLISENGSLSKEKFNRYVNDTVRISLYGDLLYPMAQESTLEGYLAEKPENIFSSELTEIRRDIWQALRKFPLNVQKLSPAKFIHFGTTRELLHLVTEEIEDYTCLEWNRSVSSSIDARCAGCNSVLAKDSTIGENCFLEVSHVHNNASVGNNVLLSHIDIDGFDIPSNVVIHGLKLKSGKFTARIYGISDNPKDTLESNCSFFNTTLRRFMEINSISPDELWNSDDHSLWTARLYPVCDSVSEGVQAALNLYSMATGNGNAACWRNAERQSLYESFRNADYHAILAWHLHMRELVCMERICSHMQNRLPASQIQGMIGHDLSDIQKKWYQNRLEKADILEQMRLHYYIGTAMGNSSGDREKQKAFVCIQKALTFPLHSDSSDHRITKDVHVERLPLRVNWGGGWSDTPPYCLECGGTVLNAAILLEHRYPVEVSLQKTTEAAITFVSCDMNVHRRFTRIEELQHTGNPYDPCALQKAALLALGIIPRSGGNLAEILKKLGGGFIMQSEVTGVPKGSGLGTSSILAAACVKALCEFMSIPYTDQTVYSHVLQIEQIMSTGGGWQDQAGGFRPGVKYITSRPNLHQQLSVQPLTLSPETRKELNERFALIYTGQRRLARNLLRDIVGRYIGNECDTAFALNEIQKIAALMRFELERGHVDDFAHLLNRHWELSRMIDDSSTNALIDQIFISIEPFIDGKMICGAGGGGFLQVILKKEITREQVHLRLKETFQNSAIDIWDCELLFEDD